MGVPQFYSWMRKTFDNLETSYADCDNLCLDWNGGIHPACAHILRVYSSSDDITKEELEKLMVKEVCTYLDFVVSKVKPRKRLYIAIDGVSPKAKANQQRCRRFKRVLDKHRLDEIRSKHNSPLPYDWDTNAISCGTEFMSKIINEIKLYRTNFDVEIVFSLDKEMEGEQKIMQFISTLSENESVCVYGLDADLIFLSMIKKRKIIVLRESALNLSQLYETDFTCIDIDIIKKNIYRLCCFDANADFYKTIYDFVVLMFLFGNDFVPNIPCLHIDHACIQLIVNAYKKNKSHLLTDDKIQYSELYNILNSLQMHEGKLLLSKSRKCFSRSAPMFHGMLSRDISFYEHLWPPEIDTIRHGAIGWKDRFYKEYFGINRFSERHKLFRICNNYLEALQWIWLYYKTNTVPSWSWSYDFHHSPNMSDLIFFMKKQTVTYNFVQGNSHKPLEQLVSVLPRESFHLLPDKLQMVISKSDFDKYFPQNYPEYLNLQVRRSHTVISIPYIDDFAMRKIMKLYHDM